MLNKGRRSNSFNTNTLLIAGGNWNNSANAGVFYRNNNNNWGNSNNNYGWGAAA